MDIVTFNEFFNFVGEKPKPKEPNAEFCAACKGNSTKEHKVLSIGQFLMYNWLICVFVTTENLRKMKKIKRKKMKNNTTITINGVGHQR